MACEDLLHVLAKPDGHSHPPALAAFASRHPLLRYRLFRAWQSLSVSTELRHELAASEKRVRWQLFRIYRARNLTVHHGDDVAHVTSLLDTLQYYLSVVLMRILRELMDHPNWQLDDAISSLLRESRYVRDSLQVNPQRLTTRDFLVDAAYREDEPLWPSA